MWNLRANVRLLSVLSTSLLLIMSLTSCFDGGSSSDSSEAPPAINQLPPPCEEKKVWLDQPNKPTQTFQTVQEAINAATDPNAIVSIGLGKYPEVVSVTDKSDLLIRSVCQGQVSGFNLVRSKNLTINGISIDGKGTGTHGIALNEDNGGNDSIKLQYVEITNVDQGYNGISVFNKQTNISIENAYIHHNKGNGIEFVAQGGPHTISKSIISDNGLNGLRVATKHQITLLDNKILANGTLGQSSDGYGIRIHGDERSDDFTLTNNIIALNNGQIIKNKATKDVSGFSDLFDSSDSGNLTSGGTEGPGVAVLTNTTRPVINLSVKDPVYTQNPQFNFSVAIDDSTPVSTIVKENGIQILLNNDFIFNVTSTLIEGFNTFDLTSTDKFGNKGSASLQTIVFDKTPPVIQVGAQDYILTNKPAFQIPVTITDISPTTTVLIQNGVTVATSYDKQITFNVTLTEGENKFEVKSIDAALNAATPVILNSIVLDTVPPVISNLSPKDSSILTSNNISVSGSANEALLSAKVNGYSVPLSQDRYSFSGIYVATNEGPLTLHWEISDLAGNVTTQDISVQLSTKVLFPNLISVEPDPTTGKLLIRGAQGAAKPGVTVNAHAGFFQNGSAVANNDGSFAIPMDFFRTATVSAFNDGTGETESTTVSFGVDTQLSGVVKDSDGIPLSGATVSILGSALYAVTNSDGVFSLGNPLTGDQTLIIDGTTIPQSVTGPNKKFSITRVSINVGLSQSNVLQRPIFLAPLLLDGSETQVVANASTTVVSSHAPGVAIDVPAGSATFPDGTQAGAINLATVPSEHTTIAPLELAKPDTVISLEPSGLSFSQPVQLTLPNDNELPAGVDLVILSLNSKKGIWEVDGSASVSQDGQSIVTKPGLGITHFSEIYAAPVGPVIQEVGSLDRSGTDVFNGALTSSILLPSFKSIGKDYSPSLTYRSSWAKPTALVTSYFDIPQQKISFDSGVSSSGRILHVAGNLFCVTADKCYTDYQDYFEDVRQERTISVSSWYEPDSITAQFFVGTLAGSPVTFSGPPARSVISYAFELKDPTTNQYLNSGAYFSDAKFQLKLKHMLLTTVTVSHYSSVFGTQIRQDSHPESRTLDELFPRDLTGNLYVQNKIGSEAGRGWRINGVQQIVNPQSNRIMLEEEDGNLAIYALNDSISTVFDGEGNNIDLSQGTDLSNWQRSLVTSTDGMGHDSISQIDLSSSASTPVSLGSVLNLTGYMTWNDRNINFYDYHLYFNRTEFHSQLSQLAQFPDGTIVGTDLVGDRLFKIAGGTFSTLGGSTDSAPQDYTYGFSYQGLQNICQYSFGIPCPDSYQVIHCIYSFFGGNCNGSGNNSMPIPLATDYGDGTIPFSPYYFGLNSPMGIVANSDGRIIIADTGNNRIRTYDLTSKYVTSIAGNGQNFDYGDGGPALNAGIFHPRGIVYDNLGNLYVSSERGYIRKIDASGNISTFAGKPLELGGVLGEEGAASEFAFNRPFGMAVDSVNGYLYVADTDNHRIVRIDFLTMTAKVVAGNGTCTGGDEIGDNGAALNASLCHPTHLGFDDQKNLLIVDSGHNKIRRVAFQSATNGTLAFLGVKKDGSTLIRNSDSTWVRKYRDGSLVNFDSNGHELANQSRVGAVSTYQYDSDGRLISQTDPAGQSVVYQYSGQLLSSITDPANRTTSFNYSGNQLIEVDFPDGTSRKFDYDSDGLLQHETNERGFITQFNYNQWNRLASVVRADNSTTTVNDSGSASAANNYVGGTVGQLKTFGAGPDQVNDGIVDARSVTTTYVKDNRGYITEIVDGAGNTTEIRRDSEGRPISILRPNGSSVNLAYDPQTSDLLSFSDSDTGLSQTVVYDQFGNVLKKTDGRGVSISTSYDSNTGLPVLTSSTSGQQTSYTYNQFGQTLTSTTLLSNGVTRTVSYAYDAKGNVIKITDPTGAEIIRELDSAGNPTKIYRRFNSIVTSQMEYTYDVFNRITSAKTADGKITTYTYFPTGEVNTSVDPFGNTTVYGYDKIGQLTSSQDANGKITSYQYDPSGNLIQATDPNGNIMVHEYNNLNQRTKSTLPDDVFTYAYNSRGKVIQVKNNETQVDLNLDSLGRVRSIQTQGIGNYTYLPNVVIQYSYDNAGNRGSVSDSMGATNSYSFDSANRLLALTNSNGENFGFGYDGANRLTQVTRPGSQTSFTFSFADFVVQIAHTNNLGNLLSMSYEFDNAGNRSAVRTTEGDHLFQYDINNQLTSATHPQSIYPTLPSETFSYDTLGNRTADSKGSYNYDSKMQQLTGDYNNLYFYDSNGNMTGKQPRSGIGEVYKYNYSSLNQLIAVQVYNGIISGAQTGPLIREVNYLYDAIGRRIEKRVKDYTALSDPSRTFSRRYVYDGAEIWGEYDSNNNLLARYTHSSVTTDDILSVSITAAGVDQKMAQSEGSYFFIKDAQGSILQITDSGGSVVQKQNYSVYGVPVSTLDSSGQDISANSAVSVAFSYTGREYDKETGLYYYRARYYDPNTGRFLQQDTKPGQLSMPITTNNKYAYAANSPNNITDPSGLSWVSDFFGGVADQWNHINAFVQDAIVAAIVIVAIVASGGSLAPAAAAVFYTALGAAAASMAMAAFQDGDFWQNTANNFHPIFRVSAAFLGGSAIYAGATTGGVTVGHQGLQGFVKGNSAFMPAGGKGLTIGASSVMNEGVSTAIESHELGHTYQFIGLAAVSGATARITNSQNAQMNLWTQYFGLGILGYVNEPWVGVWWENMAGAY